VERRRRSRGEALSPTLSRRGRERGQEVGRVVDVGIVGAVGVVGIVVVGVVGIVVVGVVGTVGDLGRGAGDSGELGGGFADGLGVGGGGGLLGRDVREGLDGAGAGGGEDEGGLVVGDGAEVVEDGVGVGGADPVEDLVEAEAGAVGDVEDAEGGVEEVLEEELVHGRIVGGGKVVPRGNARRSTILRTSVDIGGEIAHRSGCKGVLTWGVGAGPSLRSGPGSRGGCAGGPGWEEVVNAWRLVA
jgi:hypothetical protein